LRLVLRQRVEPRPHHRFDAGAQTLGGGDACRVVACAEIGERDADLQRVLYRAVTLGGQALAQQPGGVGIYQFVQRPHCGGAGIGVRVFEAQPGDQPAQLRAQRVVDRKALHVEAAGAAE
jgi:hypothetical protein